MSYPERPLGVALRLECDKVEVRVEDAYAIAGVYGFGRGLFDRERITGAGTQYQTLHRLHAGSVVLSKLKAFEGAIAVIPDQFDGRYLSPEFPTFAVDVSQSNARYLHHLCAWPQLWARLAEQSTGIGSRRERVNPRQLLSTSVPLPDLAEQCRVASKLDAVVTRLDDIARFRLSQAQEADAVRDALLQRTTNSSRLESLVRPVSKIVDVDSTRIYSTIGIYSYGRGIFERSPLLGVDTNYRTFNQIEAGQFIYSKLFGWEGALAIVPDKFDGYFASGEFPTFELDRSRVDPGYFAHVVKWPRLHNSLRDKTTGMGSRRQRVNVVQMLAADIPLPALADQRRIAAMLDKLARIPSRRELGKMAQFQEVRESLLNAAFTGKL